MRVGARWRVSMESGLEDRNNPAVAERGVTVTAFVSMESGLEDRNNCPYQNGLHAEVLVSMESGLEDRNNSGHCGLADSPDPSLNGVRPRRPEQSGSRLAPATPGTWSQWSPA